MRTADHRPNFTGLITAAALLSLACFNSAGCATGEEEGGDPPQATGGAAGQSGQGGADSDASLGGAGGNSGTAGAAGTAGVVGQGGEAGAGGQAGSAGESGAGGQAGAGGLPGTGGSSTGGSSTGGSSTGGAAGTVQMPTGCSIPGYFYDCVPSTNQGCDTASGEACDYDSNAFAFVCYAAQYPYLNDAGLGQPCDLADGPTCEPTLFCSTDDVYSTSGTCVKYCCSDSDCAGNTECLAYEPGNGTLGGCYDSSTGGTGGSGGAGGSGGQAGSAGSAGAGGTAGAGAGGTAGTGGAGGAIQDAGPDASGGSTGQGGQAGSDGGMPPLFFSEYVEGVSNDKAIELYNPGPAAYDLGNCVVRIHHNGTTVPDDGGASYMVSFPAGTTLAAGDVRVLCHSSASAAIIAVCDDQTSKIDFNGDDAVELECEGITLDVFGQIGFDPGTEWGVDGGTGTTADQVLLRKCSVTQGDQDGADAFDPDVQWDSMPANSFTDLGTRICP